jgi:hypothetical protein
MISNILPIQHKSSESFALRKLAIIYSHFDQGHFFRLITRRSINIPINNF